MGCVPAGRHRQAITGTDTDLMCTELRLVLLSGDVQRAVLSLMFSTAVTPKLQFPVAPSSQCPTESFWGDTACSRRCPELLLWFLSSFILTGE